jgi:putative flippase GtrA
MLKILIDIGIGGGLSQVLAGLFYIAASFLINKFYVFKA